MRPSWLLRLVDAKLWRRQVAIFVLLLCMGMSAALAFQDRVRWSKDYIYSGGQLAATVQSTAPYQSNSCKVYLPLVAKGETLATALAIQNTSSSTVAKVTIRYIDKTGLLVATLNKEIPPRQSIFIEQNAFGSGLDSITSWRGSAVVESQVPLTVAVNVYAVIQP